MEKETSNTQMTYPYDRPGPGQMKSYNHSDKIVKKLRKFNYGIQSIEDLNNINWGKIVALEMSDDGSEGVIFVETENGAFVIKGSSDPAIEYFSYHLLTNLKIKTPQQRILEYSHVDFQTMIIAIDRASYIDPTIKQRVRSRLDRPFIMLMEYIPGYSIGNIGTVKTKAAFDPSFPESRDRLIRMGIIIATDCFLNNSDRIPLIWKNEGNSENLIVKVNSDWTTTTEELRNPENLNLKMSDLYAIDNRPYLYDKVNTTAKANYENYLVTFEKLIFSLFEILKTVKEGKVNPYEVEAKRFEYGSIISTFIYNNTLFDIKPLGELQILLGMVMGFVNFYNFGYDRINEIYKMIALTPKSDWMNIWKDNSKSLKIEMLSELLEIAGKLIRNNDEIIQWVNVITLNSYLLKFEEGIITKLVKDEIKNENCADEYMNYDIALDKKCQDLFGISLDEIKKEKKFEKKQKFLEAEALKKAVKSRVDEAMKKEEELRKNKIKILLQKMLDTKEAK